MPYLPALFTRRISRRRPLFCRHRRVLHLCALLMALAPLLPGAEIVPTVVIPSQPELIVPNARRWNQNGAVQVAAVQVRVAIVEQTATTVLEFRLHNPGAVQQEAQLLLPVPNDAVFRGLDYDGLTNQETAKLLPRDEARRIYDEIVNRRKDPALLEFVGTSLIKSSVFPIPPGGSQSVKITYEQLLLANGPRVDYLLPRSETLANDLPWDIEAKIVSTAAIATLYSPSHTIETSRAAAGQVGLKLTAAAQKQAGPFQFSFLKAGDGVSASLFAYPDPTIGGGYFLFLAGLPVHAADALHASPQNREVTLVLDCSGSMKGEKLKQVQAAALQILRALEPGEAFNLISYNNVVETFSAKPVFKDDRTLAAAEAFVNNLEVTGGTNIYDALQEALRQPTADGHLPIVLFLTDGLPTIGKTDEPLIRDLALKHNPHQRRIFTVGVGADLNAPLLEKIAAETRATATYILSRENATQKIGTLFKRLAGPVFAAPQLQANLDAQGGARIAELYPRPLPDLFEGDQLVLLGRYIGDAPLKFTVTGDFLGAERSFDFTFDLAQATTRNSFVPRLWAARKIEALVDKIRQVGADSHNPGVLAANPELKATVDEIVKLSVQYGILTEYTAFLALEATDLTRPEQMAAQAAATLEDRALDARSGAAGVNQEMNKQSWKMQKTLNKDNEYYDHQLNRVCVGGVRQVQDRTFFRRDNRWVDSRIADSAMHNEKPAKTIEFGSAEYRTLVSQLAADNRQACVALDGDLLLFENGESMLVKAAPAAAPGIAN